MRPESLLAWQRVRAANLLSNSGPQWAKTLASFNSGTYNNEYLVFDSKLFKIGEPMQPNTLWVIDQIPTLVKSSDETDALKFGYFPSYNVPFQKDAFDLAGYANATEKYGPAMSWQMAPRARIFRRDANKVNTMDDLKQIMRYNDYLNDPYEEKNPMWAICSRGDLKTQNPSAGGCYDTKVTELSWINTGKAEAINGPTTSHGLPVFEWNKFQRTPHYGLPPVYNFTFQTMEPMF